MAMTLGAAEIYALLPAIHQTRDAAAGGPLKALFGLIAEQVGVLEQDLRGLYDDEFIETCSPWVVPYIGDLIGWTGLLPGVPATAGGRAEVANTIGYRRRKGTVIALEQLGADVTGRSVRVVEYFRRLAVNQSLHHLRPDAGGYADLRDGSGLSRSGSPFETQSRTVDVRRIAPRYRIQDNPDRVALDIALHGAGRYNIPDVGAWVWRWTSYPVTGQPAHAVDRRRFLFSPLGADMPLFNFPSARTAFDHLTTRADVPQPIGRREFHDDPGGFYGPDQSILISADGIAVDLVELCVCNLSDVFPGADWAAGPADKVAIDPVLGRISFPASRPPPGEVTVGYSYGFPADIGGGPSDRTQRLPLDRSKVTWQRVIGAGATDLFGLPLTLEAAVAAFNSQAEGTVGLIVLSGFAVLELDLTGSAAIVVKPGSQLWIVAAETHGPGGGAGWSPVNARVTLRGDIEIFGASDPKDPTDNAPEAQVFLSGVLLAGAIRVTGRRLDLTGRRLNVSLQDCTLVPGNGLTRDGHPVSPDAASLTIEPAGASLMLERTITGPVLINAAAAARMTDSIVDATAPWRVAFAGPDGTNEGGTLHLEDSTVIGKVRAHLMPLASNTAFLARRPVSDPWQAAIWCTRRQSGCVRFCFVPSDALTPRQYRCLPNDPALENALAPKFITLRYGRPCYALLSGDCPVAVWQGADDGNQIGAYHLLYETQGIANFRARLDEYLPFNLEAGIFLIPSRPEIAPLQLGYGAGQAAAGGSEGADPLLSAAIGVALI
jgi:hypothetical protein